MKSLKLFCYATILTSSLFAQARSSQILTCENFRGFQIHSDGGTSGHLFKVEFQSDNEATLLQLNGKDMNKDVNFETKKLSPEVTQLVFRDYRKMLGIDFLFPSVRKFSEVIVFAKSNAALISYLQGQEMISEQDAESLLNSKARAASYTLTRDGFDSEDVGTPYPNMVNAYNPCR